MAYWINRNGTWTQISEAGGTSQKIFVNAGGASNTWKQAQRIFVRQGAAWQRVYARVPTAPSSVSMTVNGSSASTINVTSSSFTVNSTWTNTDATLPVEVEFMNGGSQVGSTQNLSVGSTSTSTSLSITQGQTINLLTYARARNGGPSLDGADVYSSIGSSNAIAVSYPTPEISSVSVLRVSGTNDIAISWTVSNPPSSNYYYTVEWNDNINNVGYVALSDTNNQDQFASLPGTTHGFVLLGTSSTTVTIYIAVTLYINSAQVGNVGYGSNSFFTEDAQ